MKTISLAILATLFAIPVHAQCLQNLPAGSRAVSYTHLRAHETVVRISYAVCCL